MRRCPPGPYVMFPVLILTLYCTAERRTSRNNLGPKGTLLPTVRVLRMVPVQFGCCSSCKADWTFSYSPLQRTAVCGTIKSHYVKHLLQYNVEVMNYTHVFRLNDKNSLSLWTLAPPCCWCVLKESALMTVSVAVTPLWRWSLLDTSTPHWL